MALHAAPRGGSSSGIALQPARSSSYSRPLPKAPVDGFVKGAYRVLMEVREFEVDRYGVVGNAVYPQYLQHARVKALAALGWPADVLETEHGLLIATVKQTIKYRAPLRPRDKFFVQTSYIKLGSCTGTLSDRIVRLTSEKPPELVLESVADCTWIGADYKPKRAPRELREAMQQQCALYASWLEACGGEENLPLLF